MTTDGGELWREEFRLDLHDLRERWARALRWEDLKPSSQRAAQMPAVDDERCARHVA